MSTDNYCSSSSSSFSEWKCGDTNSYCGSEGDGSDCVCMPDIFSNIRCTSNVERCDNLITCSSNNDCQTNYICAIGCCETSHCIPLCSDYYNEDTKDYQSQVIVVIVGAVIGVVILLLVVSIITVVIQQSRRLHKTVDHNDHRPMLPNNSPSNSDSNNNNNHLHHNNNNNNNNDNNDNNNNNHYNIDIDNDHAHDNARVAVNVNANAAANNNNNNNSGNGNDNRYINGMHAHPNDPGESTNVNDPVPAPLYSSTNPFYGRQASLNGQIPQISITNSTIPAPLSSDNLEEYIQERIYTPVHTQPLGVLGLQRNVSESFSRQFEGTTKVTDATVWNDIKNNPDMYCSICMGEFTLDTKIAQLKCEHILHKNCAIEWLSTNPTCPVCRSQVNKFS